ncbi:MAG: hypothetical protein ACI9VR_003199, partial [Cognaticolwellia sp.]
MSASGPPRSAGALGVFQALLLGLAAWYLGQRWPPAGFLCGAALLAQLGAAAALLAGASAKWTRWAALLSLALAALIVGLHLQVGVHVVQSFGLSAAKGWALMGVAVGGGAGACLIPVIQLFVLRGGGLSDKMGAAAVLLLPLLVPPLYAVSQLNPEQGWSNTGGQESLALAYESWTGETVNPRENGVHALGVLYVLRDGQLASQTQIDGPRTQGLIDALPKQPPGPRDALVFEEVNYLEPLPELAFDGIPPILSPGHAGLYGPQGVQGSLILWRSPSVRRRPLGGDLRAPAVDPALAAGATHRADLHGWMASSQGVSALEQTWTAPKRIMPETLFQAAVDGAQMLRRNMRDNGRFAYIVKGPSGELGRGYNYPRHAGGAWYLARVYSHSGDAQARAGAEAAIAHLASVTKHLPDGRAFVHDPGRRDGKAWVGTTALALLALTELDVEPELQQGYAAFIASSVDSRGSVRGDMNVGTGEWPKQPQVTYAQGQGLLALAAAERAGLTGVSGALDRAIAFVEGDYWPLPAANFAMLDEHWMCLAAVTVHQVRGIAAGERVCTAYLADVAWLAPDPYSAHQPAAGPAAGLAEAVIARAELDRRTGREGP